MKKLRLDLEKLRVETFDTAEALPERGTVRGHEEYTYYCETDPECRTGYGTSCYPTRCWYCSTQTGYTDGESCTCP